MKTTLTTPELEEIYERGFSRKKPTYLELEKGLTVIKADTFFIDETLVSVTETKKYLFILIIK